VGCRSFEVNGIRDRSRGRKTWDDYVKDLVEWALDRVRSHMQKSSIPCMLLLLFVPLRATHSFDDGPLGKV